MPALRSVEQHLAEVLAAVVPLATQTVPLVQAHGRTLREPVRAAVDVPVFDNSAMDGFAVRFADVAGATASAAVTLAVVADLPAGTAEDPPLQPGEAARIMTGAPVPADADAIVPFEHTAGGLADSLRTATVLCAPRMPGAHIRRAGEDACTGDVVLPAGIVLGALQLSAAAAAGAAEVAVSARPRVAVVPTGTELVAPGTGVRRGQIPESNGALLAALATDAGAEVVHRSRVDDDGPALRAVLARVTDPSAPEAADVVVLSGGVSAGAYEVVRNELADAMSIVTVAMQPGKPQGFGRLPDGTLLFGLPGNPVACAVSFEAFVRPALLALQGRADPARRVIRLPAAAAWRSPSQRRQYLPAVIDRTDPARWSVAPATAGGSASHLAAGLGGAEAYAVVPSGVAAVDVGDLVDVMLIA